MMRKKGTQKGTRLDSRASIVCGVGRGGGVWIANPVIRRWFAATRDCDGVAPTDAVQSGFGLRVVGPIRPVARPWARQGRRGQERIASPFLRAYNLLSHWLTDGDLR